MSIILMLVILGLAAQVARQRKQLKNLSHRRIEIAAKYITLAGRHVDLKRGAGAYAAKAMERNASLCMQNERLEAELALARRATLAMMMKAEERRGLTKNDWLSEATRR